jgi:hypothetical protein
MTDPDDHGSNSHGPDDGQSPGEPGPDPEADIDAAFAAIIAEFSTSVPRGAETWPTSEDLDDEQSQGAAGGSTDSDLARQRREAGRRRIVLPDEELIVTDRSVKPDDHDQLAGTPDVGSQGTRDDEDEAEGYVPPIPPPLPRGDVVSRLAWGGVLGGPIFLLFAAMAGQTQPEALLLLALLAFIGGFVTLVARMPSERPDDPDDGAVV